MDFEPLPPCDDRTGRWTYLPVIRKHPANL